MKLDIYKIQKKDQLIYVILLYNKTKSCGKDFVSYKHNHTFRYLNTIKVNSKVKNTIIIEVTKKYYPSDISKNIKDVK